MAMVFLFLCEFRTYFSRLISLGPHTIVIAYDPESTMPGASYGQCYTCFCICIVFECVTYIPGCPIHLSLCPRRPQLDDKVVQL